MNKLAKALYDNTAECPDELAFRKGDVMAVLDQHVAGTSGWWMCSLYGRRGLAPANRLQLLPHAEPCTAAPADKSRLSDAEADGCRPNIYHTPVLPRPTSSPAYERMDVIYKVPSTPLSSSKSPVLSQEPKHGSDGADRHKPSPCGAKGEVYDVPGQVRRASLLTTSTAPRHVARKHSVSSVSDLEKKLGSPERSSCSSPGDAYVYAVPPPLHQDPNYDIPVPSSAEDQHKPTGGYSTLPNLRKPEWIYDVPVGPEKLSSSPQGSYSGVASQLYDTLPSRAWPPQIGSPASSLYDIPKPSCLDIAASPKALPIYDKPPTQTLPEEQVYAVPPKEDCWTQFSSNPPRDHVPLECRGDTSNVHKLNKVCTQWRNFVACKSFHNLPGSAESVVRESSERGRSPRLSSASESQRISTASSSSTSSCDSLALSSSSPEPLREVTLSQEEACRRLLDLQESICKVVPRLMDFVSSHWRSKEHLQKHLKEIREAAEGISASVTGFLNFSLDVKGNARRLTDTNLQTRLYKQLSIVEDSGVILQQTVSALNAADWPLNALCQDTAQVQTPDQLDRFVMVARTIPEDVKRLVSIIIANGKLLFRAAQKDPEPPNASGQPETKKSPNSGEEEAELLADDNDYVELQTKTEFEQQQQSKTQTDSKETTTAVCSKVQPESKRLSSESISGSDEAPSPTRSEHCRLYFGALQKAIGGFVVSLQDGQPPEKFISQSKLVIMVGQRLVDTLCREAQRAGSGQSLLCKSNHLCALLKQLAVATKKAALHFPEKQALHEAQEFAKELAQRAQHFRISLEL